MCRETSPHEAFVAQKDDKKAHADERGYHSSALPFYPRVSASTAVFLNSFSSAHAYRHAIRADPANSSTHPCQLPDDPTS
jgi:hypothetical protein